jgi:nitrogen-specific signal transduction histidine kinase/CheY-like chemotaxis protein
MSEFRAADRPAPPAGGAPAADPAAAAAHCCGQAAEIEAEVRKLRQRLAASERALAHSEKLQALGQLLSGVAHELANPLTSMIARATLIATVRTLEDARRHAEIIRAQGERATSIVRNLSSFARRRPSTRSVVSLNEVVQAVVDLHRDQLEANRIRLLLELAPALDPLEGDPHELEQVLLNLVMNAQHAMVHARGGGVLRIRTYPAGDRVGLAVEDDGPGIPAETLPHIFKPFFSTKGEEGTGLGLAIVRDLVSRHGGEIRPTTLEGLGTAMVVELPPLRRRAAEAARDLPPGHRAGHGRGLLLVVDDDPEIGRLIVDLVRCRGDEAEWVESAAAALGRVRAAAFRGILTDLTMPAMDGAQFWQILRREAPELAQRTIFMTGDHAKPETARLLESTGQPCLTKPFRDDELYDALRILEIPAG